MNLQRSFPMGKDTSRWLIDRSSASAGITALPASALESESVHQEANYSSSRDPGCGNVCRDWDLVYLLALHSYVNSAGSQAPVFPFNLSEEVWEEKRLGWGEAAWPLDHQLL